MTNETTIQLYIYKKNNISMRACNFSLSMACCRQNNNSIVHHKNIDYASRQCINLWAADLLVSVFFIIILTH